MKTAVTAFVSAVVGGLVAAVVIFAGFGGLGGEPAGGTTTVVQAPPAEEEPAGASDGEAAAGGSMPGSSVREVYVRDGPGVVSVDVASEGGPGGGSGFVLDRRGYIVTNQHVVEGAEGVTVEFAGGGREEAEVVGEDPSTDVAVLKVEASGELLKPLTLGDSDDIRVGEPVIAIGNPMNVGISVTTGIVSATGRPIKAPNNYTIDGALQTDAAMNPGNSGGPLLDAGGRVIGVNSQILSATGSFQGVGFAVPINTVKGAVEQIIATGEVVHGWVGVSMSSFGIEELRAYAALSEEELRGRHGLPPEGVIVEEVVPGGPAEKAGIRGGEGEPQDVGGFPVRLGDVITAVEGEPASDPDDVISVVNSLKPGDRMSLTVVAPGDPGDPATEPRTVEVVLEAQPDGT